MGIEMTIFVFPAFQGHKNKCHRLERTGRQESEMSMQGVTNSQEHEPGSLDVKESAGNAPSEAAEQGDEATDLSTLLAAEEVVLSAELAELLRWRELVWHLIPALPRKLVLPCLTLKETLRLGYGCDREGRGRRARPLDEGVQGPAQCRL